MTHGPLGTFRGRIGNIVGSTWKGKQVIRQRQTAIKAGFSEQQIQHQIKFSLVAKMLQPLTELVKLSFSQDPARMTRNNKAFSLNYRRAITGTYPDLRIDYNLVILGRGKLSGVAKVSCDSPSSGLVQLNWMNFGHSDIERDDDKMYLVYYCERLNHWGMQVGIAERQFNFCSTHDPALSGETLHIYIGFISANGKQSSDSQYLGVVEVA